MKKIEYGAGVFAIQGFLTPPECDAYISDSEAMGYDEAEIQTARGSQMYKDIRNNDRVIFDDAVMADNIFNRIKAMLPQEVDGWELIGLNERLRFYRYEPGQYFKWHRDGSYARSEKEASLLSFLIFLNEDYEGGEIAFRWDKIKPEKGSVVVFPHATMHQGSTVESGVKYVLRTDVMYREIA
ncbi:2OG-Fe(II) oxygenase [Hahella sp. HN01]|uniref:prolyl hydroxylase family protein n=1 Tax=Hahella sp. HN01 TaxID=2847262 RepID=UPI001C1EE1C5|nr:2OG-Fe(II) oxygenase [Hahella sp. HN01]MBU6951043.1 2OG-Fe(II) oxygenase [Hahella sp. HN01]